MLLSFYPFGMWDQNSIFSKVENGFAIKLDLNEMYVEAFNNRTFNQDGNENAIIRIKFYKPPNLIFQHLLVKEKVYKIEVNRMKNGYI